MTAGDPQVETAGRLHGEVVGERDVAVRDCVGHDAARADRDRLTMAAIGQRLRDEPFDEPRV
jgi:hypothetical protein